ncbi:hypothetical protein KQX54_006619 [Cotesia glomerata]|uniref:Transmembrane protein n=1 Tax=Cotesia glomerata TaxID=32391 RepID=A0AAV7J1I5_COTGL|nr:hypothetical protein KQX54_006619 [Cotesia glomerata]
MVNQQTQQTQDRIVVPPGKARAAWRKRHNNRSNIYIPRTCFCPIVPIIVKIVVSFVKTVTNVHNETKYAILGFPKLVLEVVVLIQTYLDLKSRAPGLWLGKC